MATLTANNTSTSNTFAGTANGNIKPGSVSKVPLRNLLYTGATTKIYAHIMGWWGSPSHVNVGYNSTDPTQALRQVQDMISRGIDGTIVDWYGPDDTFIDGAMQAIKSAAEQNSGFEFAVCEDWGALRTAPDVNAKLIADVTYIYNTYEQSPNYMRKGGRPVIFLFGEEQLNINWPQVIASVPGNPLFIWENAGGFTMPGSSGGYGWIGLTNNPNDMGLAYLDDFYNNAVAHVGEHAFGAPYKGFDDSIASWGSNRKLNQQCGQTWLATFADISKHYSASNQLENIQIPTWNDYEEGTEIESGIDNCVSIAASVSGQTLNWVISGQENTIDHYNVYVSSDGQNMSPLGEVPAGTHSMNLSGYQLPPGQVALYVEAVGQPGMMNHLSGPAS